MNLGLQVWVSFLSVKCTVLYPTFTHISKYIFNKKPAWSKNGCFQLEVTLWNECSFTKLQKLVSSNPLIWIPRDQVCFFHFNCGGKNVDVVKHITRSCQIKWRTQVITNTQKGRKLEDNGICSCINSSAGQYSKTKLNQQQESVHQNYSKQSGHTNWYISVILHNIN